MERISSMELKTGIRITITYGDPSLATAGEPLPRIVTEDSTEYALSFTPLLITPLHSRELAHGLISAL